MTAKELLNKKGPKVITAKPDQTVLEAVSTMVENKVGSVLVVDADNKPLGIFTERDLMRVLTQHKENSVNVKVSEAMTEDMIVCSLEDQLEQVRSIMTEERVRHVPIMSDGTIAGMISIGDIVKETLSNVKFEARHLRDYIMGRY